MEQTARLASPVSPAVLAFARLLFHHSRDAILVLGADGLLARANTPARRLLRRLGWRGEPWGRSLETLLGTRLPALLRRAPDNPDPVRMTLACTGPRGRLLLRCTLADLRDDDGRVLAAVLTGHTLARVRRRQAVPRLAASAAHEIRNPLTAIRGFVQLLDGPLTGQPEAKYLSVMRDEIERMERITAGLLQIGRAAKVQVSPCDLAGALRSVAALTRARAAESGIELRVEQEPALPPVLVDPDRLRQVLLNLIGNAVEAMSGPGVVELAARRAPGGLVEAAVSDQGPGIAPETLSRLFEPFFTTKAGGTGLGLVVSESIVRRLGGRILVSSQPGQGTTFRVLLPEARIGSPRPATAG